MPKIVIIATNILYFLHNIIHKAFKVLMTRRNAKMRKSKRSAFKSAKRRAMNRRKMVGGLSKYNFVVNPDALQSYLDDYQYRDSLGHEFNIKKLVGYGIVKIKKSGSITRTEQISIFQCMDPLDTSVVKRYAIVRCNDDSCIDVKKSGANPIRKGIPNLGMEDKVLFIDKATKNNSVPNSFQFQNFQNFISSRDTYTITIPDDQENLIKFFETLSKNDVPYAIEYSEDVIQRANQLNDAKMIDGKIMSSRGPPLRNAAGLLGILN